MSVFSENLKILRKSKCCSQDALASHLGVKRTTVSNYENALSEPSLDLAGMMADFFHTDLDTLLRRDLSLLSPQEVENLSSSQKDISGRSLRVLVTTVSPENEENVEIVPVTARAGYAAGYADPQYVSSLPHISLPFLSPQRKYRAFPITGDSMPPVSSGSYVVGEYVVDWHGIKNGSYAVVVTSEDGIVFKKIYPDFKKGIILLASTSPSYSPYVVKMDDVLEIWSFSCYISKDIAETAPSMEHLYDMISKMQKDISTLKSE